ncbi:hypothetical protein Vadar_014785 [Vaccinium darrowii]|uniref:Uncharacterized protein n=1 Tax=Vaccinium darrowii TaxID=229202 RepID=A0ACB7ZC76_9ERIC|nr:hypothetical protein Vadar_014785 [Vaccinium darrowii]
MSFSGQPRRHLLTTGWSIFVSAKKLIAGDAFIFLREKRRASNSCWARAPVTSRRQTDSVCMAYLNFYTDDSKTFIL